MGIFDRMSRVISSNFNALLDKAQDPSKSIDQVLLEMREQLRAARQEAVRSVAAEKQLRAKVEDLDSELETWARRAELAVKHGDDALARDALVMKKRRAGERDRAETLRSEQRSRALEVKRELERMEAKLEELQGSRQSLVARAQQLQSGPDVSGGALVGGRAFVEFQRMEGQLEGIDAALAAQREVDEVLGLDRGPSGMTRDEVEAKFRRLEGRESGSEGAVSSEVDEELQAIKRKVRIGS